jgi:hypothetical protein
MKVGLEEDLRKIPMSMSIEECYERIYNWHKTQGQVEISEYKKNGINANPRYMAGYLEKYLNLVKAIPEPKIATIDDMNYIFGSVTYSLMEWAFHKKDERGIEMYAYAKFAILKQFPDYLNDIGFEKSRKQSKLFKEFGR